MRRLDRYIVSTVASAMLMVLLVVLSLDLVFGFIAEMEELKENYQTFQAMLYILTTVPRRIYDYLPLAAFIGSLVGLGVLANSSELTVMRAAGVSVSRIVWAAMKPALVVVLIGILIGEYVAPETERIAQTQRALAQGEAESVGAGRGVWHREEDTFIHMSVVQSKGLINGLSFFRFNVDGALAESFFARRALFQVDHWLLQDVTRTHFKENETVTETIEAENWNTQLSPKLLNILVIKPEYLSVRGLFAYVSYLHDQGLNANIYEMAFWKKVLQPLATAVLVIVAISFVFGPLRSVTMGFRIFCGIIVGLLFKYVQDLLGPSSLVFGFNPVFATLVPIVISAVAGVYLLRRVK
ncbi:MAG: LPS export ABC transporter permease LptG [Hahellaceae bacterium]|nr:LPS export ABC transporter permease LptG [Hahellaceae bacterium]